VQQAEAPQERTAGEPGEEAPEEEKSEQ
jgi:hypothetical protein